MRYRSFDSGYSAPFARIIASFDCRVLLLLLTVTIAVVVRTTKILDINEELFYIKRPWCMLPPPADELPIGSAPTALTVDCDMPRRSGVSRLLRPGVRTVEQPPFLRQRAPAGDALACGQKEAEYVKE